MVLFGTTLGDEKVVGQTLDNLDKKLSILSKYFGTGVNPKDCDAFMRARAQPEVEAAVRKMLKQKIRSVRISKRPVRQLQSPEPGDFVEVRDLENPEDPNDGGELPSLFRRAGFVPEFPQKICVFLAGVRFGKDQ